MITTNHPDSKTLIFRAVQPGATKQRHSGPPRILSFFRGRNLFIKERGSQVMTEDIHAERRRSLAEYADAAARKDYFDFHERFVILNKGRIPDATRNAESASTAISDAERRLSLEITRFSNQEASNDPTAFGEPMSRLAMAIFLLERITQIRNAVLARNDRGLYAIYAPLRDSICKLLDSSGPSYYGAARLPGMTVKDVLVSYMDGPELGIIAASYHCGLAMVPPAASIPQLYKQKLIDRMG